MELGTYPHFISPPFSWGNGKAWGCGAGEGLAGSEPPFPPHVKEVPVSKAPSCGFQEWGWKAVDSIVCQMGEFTSEPWGSCWSLPVPAPLSDKWG